LQLVNLIQLASYWCHCSILC